MPNTKPGGVVTCSIKTAGSAIPDAYQDIAMFEESESPKLPFDQCVPREQRPFSP